MNLKLKIFALSTLFLSINSYAFNVESLVKHAIKEHAPNVSETMQEKGPELKTPNTCPEHYPFGQPTTTDEKVLRRSFYTCRVGYATQFDPATKTPLWVAEVLKIENLKSSVASRENESFVPDPNIPNPAQASQKDYHASGYDQGHMAPAADMKFNALAMTQSFYYSNIVPQVGNNMNRGIWQELEKKTRSLAIRNDGAYVVTGPIFEENRGTIGHSKVSIPSHLFKIIYFPKQKEIIAFLMPNAPLPKTFKLNIDGSVMDTRSDLEVKQKVPFPQFCKNPDQKPRGCVEEDFIVPFTMIEQKTGFKFLPKINSKEIQDIYYKKLEEQKQKQHQ